MVNWRKKDKKTSLVNRSHRLKLLHLRPHLYRRREALVQIDQKVPARHGLRWTIPLLASATLC